MLKSERSISLVIKAENTPIFVIEHLEPEIGKWLIMEYRHASKIVGENRLVFTNVKKKTHAIKLSKFGSVKPESFSELFRPEGFGSKFVASSDCPDEVVADYF